MTTEQAKPKPSPDKISNNPDPAKPDSGPTTTAASEAASGASGTAAKSGTDGQKEDAPKASAETPKIDTPTTSNTTNASPEPAKPASEQSPVDEEFEKALNEPDLAPVPSDADLDAIDKAEERVFGEIPAEILTADERDVVVALQALHALVATTSPSTPDSFIVWGFGGKQITLGHLRHIASNIPASVVEYEV